MPRRDDVNPSQGFRPPDRYLHWDTEEPYWADTWSTRPYVTADRSFEHYRPAYRYGFESAQRHAGRAWSDAEHELRTGWDRYEHRNESAWEHVKDAVKDAWDRVMNR